MRAYLKKEHYEDSHDLIDGLLSKSVDQDELAYLFAAQEDCDQILILGLFCSGDSADTFRLPNVDQQEKQKKGRLLKKRPDMVHSTITEVINVIAESPDHILANLYTTAV